VRQHSDPLHHRGHTPSGGADFVARRAIRMQDRTPTAQSGRSQPLLSAALQAQGTELADHSSPILQAPSMAFLCYKSATIMSAVFSGVFAVVLI